ncbi:MAG: DUF6544 family protein, partial [Actinomycetota bacterium]
GPRARPRPRRSRERREQEGPLNVTTMVAIENRLVRARAAADFSVAEVEALPRPVRRHLLQAIEAGTPLARSARIKMHGSIRLGTWLPFHALQVLTPHEGFIWEARVAGLISGADHYADGAGAMEWAAVVAAGVRSRRFARAPHATHGPTLAHREPRVVGRA